MKVALVHYWLVNMAGGEKVLEALCRLYPQADIFTHVVDREKLLPRFRQHRISTTFIDSLPASRRLYKKYLPLMPHALEQLDLTDYDLVISSESGPAKGVITRPDCLHVCYCHTPMRYLWDNWPAYMRSTGRLSRLAMRLLLPSLRQWDFLSAQRVDHFVANSRHVAPGASANTGAARPPLSIRRWTRTPSRPGPNRAGNTTSASAVWPRTSAWTWPWRSAAASAVRWWWPVTAR